MLDAMMMAPSMSQESMSLVPRRRLLEEFLTALRKVSTCTACCVSLHLRLPAHGADCKVAHCQSACSRRCQSGGLPGITSVTAALRCRLVSGACCLLELALLLQRGAHSSKLPLLDDWPWVLASEPGISTDRPLQASPSGRGVCTFLK